MLADDVHMLWNFVLHIASSLLTNKWAMLARQKGDNRDCFLSLHTKNQPEEPLFKEQTHVLSYTLQTKAETYMISENDYWAQVSHWLSTLEENP